jgi:hypothetical protein
MGLPAFNAREVEKECLDLERRRSDCKSQLQDMGATKRHGRIQKMDFYPTTDSDDDLCSSAVEADIGDESMHHLIMELKHQQCKYARRGQIAEPHKVFKKAFRRYNEHKDSYNKNTRFQKGKYPYGARAVGQGTGNAMADPYPRQGPPNKLDTLVKRTINELLTLANVPRGHCVQCKKQGHYLHQIECALKDKLLNDRPCVKCGQGLHSADDCQKVFQREYVANQPNNTQQNFQQQDQLKQD